MTSDRLGQSPPLRTKGFAAQAARAVLKRPALWGEAARAAIATAPRAWWRRPPFLPTPDAQYLDWRVGTAYGRPDADPPHEDVAAYLRWRARMRRR